MSHPFVFDECLSDTDYTVVAANRIREFLVSTSPSLRYLSHGVIEQFLNSHSDLPGQKENAFNALEVVSNYPDVAVVALATIERMNAISEEFMSTLDVVSMFNFLYHSTQSNPNSLPKTVAEVGRLNVNVFMHYYTGLVGSEMDGGTVIVGLNK